MSTHDSTQLANNDGARQTLDLLRGLQNGEVAAKTISPDDRRRLVVYLLGDGYSNPEMAQILGVTDRTIERDKKAIRESNAVERDPEMVSQMVGRLFGEAEHAMQRIRKTIRDRNTPKALVIEGNRHCYQIFSDLVHRLQRLGYLPTATQKVEADLTHHVGEVPDLATLEAERRRLIQIAQEDPASNPDNPVITRLVALQGDLARADMADKLEDIADNIDQEVNDDTEA